MGCFSDDEISLERMCSLLKKRGVSISKQGLHQRFTPKATELMGKIFTEATVDFKTENQAVFDLLKAFSTVKSLDSSGIELPSNLKALYKGYGGSASEAALKMQVLFNYLDGQVEDIKLTGATKNDQSYKEHLNCLEKGALYLQDLGYFNVESFSRMNHAGAYFISRYLFQTQIFDEQGTRLDLVHTLRKSGSLFSGNVLLGRDVKLKVRMVATLLSEAEYQKRREKLLKEGRKKGRTPSNEALELAKWSIYVTNVPASLLKDDQIHLIYLLRWQIEIFFKLCKSEVGVDRTHGRKPDRVQCEIYAKLTCVTLFLYICFPVRWQQKDIELSFYKAYKQLKQNFSVFFNSLRSSYLLNKFFKGFYEDLVLFAHKDKNRKKRKSTLQKIMASAGQETCI